MQFSERTNWNLQATPYANALEALRECRAPYIDLTASNPTTCGFEYDSAEILRELSRPECLEYSPAPHGLELARVAVAKYYADAASVQVDSDQVFLTTSTSEAYSYLFRLHCDPGAEVLIAQPSYPLFEFLADLDDVRLVPYPLFYDHGWHIDTAALEARITPRTRALVIVHPNNPTGHFTCEQEREVLERICRQHDLALIIDEVFLDYEIQAETLRARPSSFATGDHPVLTYILSGLSKIAGLPQMKAAWIVALGPPPLVEVATARLEVIADTFLSMNAPVQHALPFLLADRKGVQRQILSRVRANLNALDCRLRSAPAISRLQVQGGWYVVLRVPAVMSGEEMAIHLLQEQQVLVHPGYFYGFEGDGWLVLSLLPRPEEFIEGINRVLNFFG